MRATFGIYLATMSVCYGYHIRQPSRAGRGIMMTSIDRRAVLGAAPLLGLPALGLRPAMAEEAQEIKVPTTRVTGGDVLVSLLRRGVDTPPMFGSWADSSSPSRM